MNHPIRHFFPAALILAGTLAFTGGCGAIVSRATEPFVKDLSDSILKQNDPELVREGLPTLILVMDGVLEGKPDDPKVLAAAAQMYLSYNTAFVAGTDAERAKVLSDKARNYAFRALSMRNSCFRDNHDKPYTQFEPCAKTLEKKDIGLLVLVTGAWASWIQAHSDNWDSIADISKLRLLVDRLIEIDDTYYYGSPHLYLGVYYTILPPALGGKIEEGRKEFEKAIEIGKGKMLTAYVLYAKQVALPTLDRDLFNRLMDHVEKTPADVVPELTLVNTIAKREAVKLKAEAATYFETTE